MKLVLRDVLKEEDIESHTKRSKEKAIAYLNRRTIGCLYRGPDYSKQFLLFNAKGQEVARWVCMEVHEVSKVIAHVPDPTVVREFGNGRHLEWIQVTPAKALELAQAQRGEHND